MSTASILIVMLASAAVSAESPAPGVQADPAPPPSTDEEAAPPPGPPPPPLANPETYDAEVRASAQSAETLQGTLDGGWRLISVDGRNLYTFQLADRGLGPQTIEGAWRDLAAPAATPHTGFLSSIDRTGETLMLRFNEAGADDLVVVTVKPDGGAWTGQLWRRGVVTKVTLQR